MNKIIVDSSAWIEYFAGREKGRKIREIIDEGVSIFITGLIVAEVSTKFLKDALPAEDAISAMKSLAILVPFDFQLGHDAAKICVHERKTKPKFGIADAHVVAAARIIRAKVITCDSDFRGLQEAMIL
ncbi:MAG: PIN domain-containing protein [Candidatus Aenigmarchaeota archaeon]|nr:PIN domain-containing protein [Candidatus Aenigmarchaeota archaeon]